VAKFGAAAITGSASMPAEGVHSVADPADQVRDEGREIAATIDDAVLRGPLQLGPIGFPP
jgi:hypothetical protein